MARLATHGAVLAAAAVVLVLAARPSVQLGLSAIQLPCTSVDDCDTAGAVCTAGACSCPRGQVMTSDLTSCLPGAGEWGAACSDAVQCVSRLLVGGSCSAAEVITSVLDPQPPQPAMVCQCAEGYHYLRGRCWRSAGLGESCKRSESCYANHDSESVACKDKVCACADGFYQREYSSCRRISTAYGQECGIVQDCQYEFSACTDRHCGCQAGYKYDKGTKKCAPDAAATPVRLDARQAVDVDLDDALAGVAWQALFGTRTAPKDDPEVAVDPRLRAAAACTAAVDCGAHSDCQSGACVCQQGYFKLAGEAACHPEVLQTCAQDGDCSMPNALCRDEAGAKVCSCKGGYIASKDMRICRKMSRALDWSCLHDEQCGYFGPGALCVSKRCKCSNGTHWVEAQQYCWVSRAVGQQCSATEDCAGLGSGGVCGWTNADGEVAGDGGASVCGCAPGFHAAADGASCRQDAVGVGAACQRDEDCVTEHTACRAAECACVAGYIPDASGRRCQLGVGGPCTSDAQCAATGSRCLESKCTCPSDHVPAEAGDACLEEVTTLNGTCSEAAQCALLNTGCRNGTCTCGEDQHFRGDRCQRRRGLGQRCFSSAECFLPDFPERTECRNGVCRCLYGFSNDDDRTCSAAGLPGGSASVLAVVACLSLVWSRRG